MPLLPCPANQESTGLGRREGRVECVNSIQGVLLQSLVLRGALAMDFSHWLCLLCAKVQVSLER